MAADDELAAAAAALAADEAAKERRRRRDLGAQDVLGASFAGIAVDLAERAASVSIVTTNGRRHRGPVRTVGRDFIALAPRRDATLYLARRAVFAITVEGERARLPSGRALSSARSLASVLSERAADRPQATVRGQGVGVAVTGTLLDAGEDVLRLQLEGNRGAVAYVALRSVAEVSVTGSG